MLDTAESLELTTSTMKLATLAGTGFAEATSQMTAALRGFKLEMSEGEHITDVYSELAAKTASDVQDIAYAMSKTASISSSAGMSFETTSAFLAQMIQVTQEAPENIGTAMKSIVARFVELKENVDGTAESQFEDLDYNRVDTALKSVGINIKDATGQFRNLDDVFLELSKQWNSMSRNSQRYIATTAAGSRQQSRFIALMEDYETTMELVEVAQNSAGKSSEQFAKAQDTVTYKVNQIKNAWEQLRLSIVNSDFTKGALDFGKELIDNLKDMDKAQVAAVAVIGSTLGKNIIINFVNELKKSTLDMKQGWAALGRAAADGFNEALDKKLDKNNKNRTTRNFEKNLKKYEQDGSYKDTLGLTQEGKDTLSSNLNNSQWVASIAKMVQDASIIDAKVRDISNEMSKIDSKGDAINNDDKDRRILLQQQLDLLKQQKQQYVDNMNAQGFKNEADANRLATLNLGGNSGTKALAGFGNAIGGAITTGLMVAISGGEVSDVLVSGLVSGISLAIPQLMTLIGTKLAPKLAPIAAKVAGALAGLLSAPLVIGVIGLALVGGIAVAIDKQQKELEEIELNRLKNIKKANEKLLQEQISAYQDLINAQKGLKKFDETIESFENLSNKEFLTPNEQTELSEVIGVINTDYSDVVLTYNENTEELRLNSVALDNFRKALIDEEETQAGQVNQKGYEQVANLKWAIDNYKETITEIEGIQKEHKYDATATQISDLAAAAKKVGIENIYSSDGTNFELSQLTAHYSMPWEDFNTIRDTVLEAYNQQIDIYGDQLISEGRQAASLQLQTIEVGGEKMSEELADSLGVMFDDTVDNIGEQSKKWKSSSSNQDFLDDFIRRYQKGDNYEDSSFYKANESDIAIFTDQLDKWNQDGVHLTTGFGGNLSKWDDLPKEFQEFATAQGNDENTWDTVRKRADKSGDLVRGYFEGLWQQQFNLLEDELSADKIQSESENLSQIESLLEESKLLTREEYWNSLVEILSQMDLEVAKAFAKGQGLQWTGEELGVYADKEKHNSNSAFGKFYNNDKVLESFGIDKELSDKLVLYLEDSLIAMLENSGLAGDDATNFGNEVAAQLTDNLTSEQASVLSSISLLDKSYIELLGSERDYVSELVAQGMDATDAAKVYNDYIQLAITYLEKAVLGAAGAQVTKEQATAPLRTFTESFGSLSEAQNEMLENGAISSETYFGLVENGFAEFVDVTSDGYVLLGDKAEAFWNKQAKLGIESYDKQIELQKAKLKELATFNVPSITKEELEELQSYIAKMEDFSNIPLLSPNIATAQAKLETDEAKILQEAIDAGYDTIQEYSDAINEGLVELESSRPDVYIQSLVAIAEAYRSLDVEVEDLTEDLDELKEKEQDAIENLNEMEKALNEAINGSENFQSSLDGLINYQNKLSQLEHSITSLKNELVSVANIEDAQGILSSLDNAYQQKTITLGAENIAIDKSLKNLKSTMLTNYGDYISFDENDLAIVDYGYTKLQANDELRTAFEEEFNTYNNYLNQRQTNLDDLKAIEEERKDFYEQSLSDFVSIQEKLISVLKEKSEEEVDITKDKYDALEEADNEYLEALEDAINKQKELRDKQNQYDELATKEKKLSLLQRDTSGANQKEITNLEQDIEQDRENLLDSEIDSVLNSLRELYETQKETRDAELEYMEQVTESTEYFADWAENIMSSWNNVDDMKAWYLENDPSSIDLTAEQTEVYLNGIEEDWTKFVTYTTAKTTEFTTDQEVLTEQMNIMYENTNNNIETLGTTIQTTAQTAADELIADAQKARDDAAAELQEIRDDIAETQKEMLTAQEQAKTAYGETMKTMVEQSQSAMEEVSKYAVKWLLENSGVDLEDPAAVTEVLQKAGYANKEGNISGGILKTLESVGVDTSQYNVEQNGSTYSVLISDTQRTLGRLGETFSTKEDAEQRIQELKEKGTYGKNIILSVMSPTSKIDKFANGGLVNYTGPAWVDGTPSKPEAFLSADDTARIGSAAKLLADLPILNQSKLPSTSSTNVGDTTIEVHINVDTLSNDYDVDQMIDRVKQEITNVANPIGNTVILNK